MTDRFADLEKIPDEPAIRMLAIAGIKLDTKLNSPANASVETVMEELDEHGVFVDQLKMMAVALPPRERVWWSCLAARDILGDDAENPSLLAAEAWVRNPSAENRHACDVATAQADPDDLTSNCGFAALYSDGTLGTSGEAAVIDAPPGGSEISAMVMNVEAMGVREDDAIPYVHMLIDRAADIARGGDGRIEFPSAAPA